MSLPASGWTAIGTKGYRFRGVAGTTPVSRVVVKGALVRIRAGHASWAYTLDEPSQGSVAVRLRLGTGPTWCANSPAKSGGRFDVSDNFVGLAHAPAPALCPAVP